MRVEFEGKCRKAITKTSASGNMYHQLDIEEKVKTNNPDEPAVYVEWKNLYFNPNDTSIKVKELENKKVKATFNFFPSNRVVGEKIYQDIKVTLIDVKEI
jgi:hypothetical protein